MGSNISRVITRVTILITLIRGLIIPLITRVTILFTLIRGLITPVIGIPEPRSRSYG